MSIYFTADPHYGHYNAILYCNRPYKTSEEMDKALIKNHNEVVGKDDTVYIVGDLSLRSNQHMNYYQSVIRKLKGIKILILGNHDTLKPFSYVNNIGFRSVHTSLEITIDGIDLILCHDPALSCIDRSKIFICAHVHDLFKIQKNVINVGVDVWDYKPVSFEELKPYIQKIKEEQNV